MSTHPTTEQLADMARDYHDHVTTCGTANYLVVDRATWTIARVVATPVDHNDTTRWVKLPLHRTWDDTDITEVVLTYGCTVDEAVEVLVDELADYIREAIDNATDAAHR